jgi:long-chain acyl-CoA synthetase
MWGRNIMMGYLNREDKTEEDLTEDGWMKSGDQGYLDKDGFLFITGILQFLASIRPGAYK